jgi:hypothetical protein
MGDETLRDRVERIDRYEVMSHPLAMDLAQPEVAATIPNLTHEEWLALTSQMAQALRVALFDLAEQIDALLGGQIKPE